MDAFTDMPFAVATMVNAKNSLKIVTLSLIKFFKQFKDLQILKEFLIIVNFKVKMFLHTITRKHLVIYKRSVTVSMVSCFIRSLSIQQLTSIA